MFARIRELEEATARYRAHGARVARVMGEILVPAPVLTARERAAALMVRRSLQKGVPVDGAVCARLAVLAPAPLDAVLPRIAAESAALGAMERALDDTARALRDSGPPPHPTGRCPQGLAGDRFRPGRPRPAPSASGGDRATENTARQIEVVEPVTLIKAFTDGSCTGACSGRQCPPNPGGSE
ncbi:hypothetical protein ETD83_28760 [Actinomadura soli]|uniref:Uncharacterized protein n=1 Tax=Actinomadura soli TaxID=2508997 RepID=A0A5C4J4R5_9ACTN|nr:hypothetical protein ETD83_28760 [Actinomadura soli]